MLDFKPTPKRYISKEEINELPLLHYSGKIEIIESAEQALVALLHLKTQKVLGFDTETKPSFQKGESYQVSLLQLATAECAYLFRLNKLPLTPEMWELLADPDIIKTGVGIKDDLRGLQKLLPFNPQGFVDLSLEAEKRGFVSQGLRPLTALFLGKRLSKGAKVTNWERYELTPAQVQYAALDAQVGLKIYERLMPLPYNSIQNK